MRGESAVPGLGLVELSPLTVSIFAASFVFNINFAVWWWLSSPVDEERGLSGHCWRIVGMELTSAGAVVLRSVFSLLRPASAGGACVCGCRLIYTIVFVH